MTFTVDGLSLLLWVWTDVVPACVSVTKGQPTCTHLSQTFLFPLLPKKRTQTNNYISTCRTMWSYAGIS